MNTKMSASITLPIQLSCTLAEFFPADSKKALVLREAAWAAFTKQGLPTKKQEQWKYTDLARLLKRQTFQAGVAQQTSDNVTSLVLPTVDAWFFVLRDGHFDPALSQLEDLPDGVTITPMHDMSDATQLAYLKKPGDAKDNAILALNRALRTDGLCLRVAKGVQCTKPIYLVYVSTHNEPVCTNHFNVIHLDAGASATLVDMQVNAGNTHQCMNNITNIVLDAHARLDYTAAAPDETNDTRLETLSVAQHQAAQFYHFSQGLGHALQRMNIDVDLLGEHAYCALTGFYFVTATQHVDHHLCVNHNASYTNSMQCYKGVADDHAHAVFNGKIAVQKGIKKIDSLQTNRNLLLSSRAQINTKPELEIYADDVKCAHGATVGQLDEAALFYLQSRGINILEAKAMLTRAFGAEVYANIKHERIRAQIADSVDKAMTQHFKQDGINGRSIERDQ